MNALRKYLDKIKPNFEEGGKLHAFRSVFDGFETFLFVPNATSKSGVNVHDAIDSKRIMSFVVIALMPALLFGMYNVGYQNYAAAGKLAEATFWEIFGYGFLAVLPKIIVSYVVGLGIEFIVAQWKNEEIHEGYLVTGMIVPLIVPVGAPLWVIAVACAYLPLSESTTISKEFGTRHRAAVGISEVSDALTIVVSEETGEVSLTLNGELMSHLSREEYLRILHDTLEGNQEQKRSHFFTNFFTRKGGDKK